MFTVRSARHRKVVPDDAETATVKTSPPIPDARRILGASASDRVVQAMIERINYTPYTELAPDYTNVTTLLRVTLNDGREYSGRVDFGKGHPKRRMDYDALAHKFHDCATHARWPEGKAKSVVEMIRQVEDIPDVRELTRLLVL